MLDTSTETSFILVVDDTLTNLEIISEALIGAGFEVATAVDGKKALEQIQSRVPDLILLDVMMPVMDGFETCKNLKIQPETHDIPVIFMTAITDTNSKVEALSLGAVDYITKPFHKAEVLARISAHLQLRSLNKNLEKRVIERTAELNQALKDLQEYQLQLVQQEKMSVLGQLVAGLAHEINNPVSCIYGNLGHALTYFENMDKLINLYQSYYPQPVQEIQNEISEMDLAYVRSDLPNLIFSMKEGIQRIRDISRSLRIFSRSDTEKKIQFDIHEGIDSTILILKHRLKGSENHPDIEIKRDYGVIPQVNCFPGQLNQVFMNILANAIDALEESFSNNYYSVIDSEITVNQEMMAETPQIIIQTILSEDESYALIKIKDNGIGMPQQIKERIFDNLFTTKPVGKGTGLGLSIARQIIIQKHGGKLEVNSEPGRGSEFIINIPIE
ncbi:Response Regulator Receiver Signal Transduction Histidine Kinase [Trichormus variabilis ATCC 29413]|uniref:histidine kinase n=3 Tax=Anabaena variabilis TaxID=264691 RepID=Q3MB66_TRIV2|nr:MULTISPECIES: response regulator [Nostocaceae]ABA21770.1 Response Regulator Receiver Signal Transduction Histidine Kinase [Trichormus variabilis ATCC 29413]MBC1215430.1 response regulator [Trichormus variabilis ARAD]MBC1255783.1 response regulator [Trichormus variabilis V5]MBC1304045.1 response regulator [Trichormus variabilis N2B]MBC1313787.1 response regulator [Trichormus variabilis PNB]